MWIKKKIRGFLLKHDLRLPRWCLNARERTVRDIAASVDPRHVVIDLGAYVGDISKELAHYAAHVYSFEPHPEIFARLKENTRGHANITCIQAAVSDVPGKCRLFSDRDPRPGKFSQGSSVIQGKSNLSYEDNFEVDSVLLPDFVGALDRPVGLIKMDIEGMEYRVIDTLLESDVIDRISMIYVEDHCDRVSGLTNERDRALKKIADLGVKHKFNFDWP